LSKIGIEEILETIEIISEQKLNIRSVTLGVNILGCASSNLKETTECIKQKILEYAPDFIKTASYIEKKFSVPIINKRLTVSPVALLLEPFHDRAEDAGLEIALALDKACKESNIDLVGGYTALVARGISRGSEALIKSIPKVLSTTTHVCSSLEVGRTTVGINVDAINMAARAVKETSILTGGIGNARFVTLSNAPSDIPFMAAGFYGLGEGQSSLNVAISGPGVIHSIIKKGNNLTFNELAEEIKKASFKISRVGQLIGKEIVHEMGGKIKMGSIDLSLAPAPEEGESIAEIIEKMGIEKIGGAGSIAALAILTDAIKKGGLMGASIAGGYSGAFIPVSEDLGMVRAARSGSITVQLLEAMTSVCSTGLDMVAVPGDTTWQTLAAIMMDEIAIGVYTNKTTGVRILPIMGTKPGDVVELGGLFGKAVVMSVPNISSVKFVQRGGNIPPPTFSNRN
jgi:uncharacterized protein (UPF0210 family)